MNKPRRDLVELAKTFLEDFDEPIERPVDVDSLAALLAAQRKAVLEEAANEWQKCALGGTHVEIQSVVQWLRQQAQEQRP